MKKSRLLALLLVMILIVSTLTGCAKKGDDAADPSTSTTPPATTDDKDKDTEDKADDTKDAVATTLADMKEDAMIGLVVKDLTALFYTSIANGAKQAVEEINKESGRNHELVICDDKGELANELANVQDLINMGCDVMIFVAMDPSSSVPAYELCLEQEDMITVIVDAPCDGSEKCDAVIVSDNYEAGRLEMEKLCDKIGGEGNVVLISDSTNPNAAIRESGAKDELKNWPKVKVLETRDIKSSVENALTAMQDLLNVYVDDGIDGVWCFSDTPAQGAVSAVQSQGYGDKIVVTGIDGNATAKQLIQDGQMYGSAAQFPNMLGYNGVYVGLNIMIGNKPKDQTTYVGVEWIDKDNVADYIDEDQ
ncbi:sugar ABC transporter substrate-binding protein [Anaerolentibacter hominis]|uniref:sugar ABC transporter substrate-binding protein n=1 Tax=Anaerolentibacter hominis TaxID=3079009 RepID=UPI0031B8028F